MKKSGGRHCYAELFVDTRPPRVRQENSRLSRQELDRFVPVRLSQGVSFGGSQRWFPQRLRRGNGCSVVAACNLLAYWGLGPPMPAEQEGFLTFQQQLYAAMPPGPLGAFRLQKWKRQVLAWAAARGAPLQAESCSLRRGKQACAAFLREQLALGRPVAALNLSLSRHWQYAWHWMVVTGFTEEGRLVVSTWGERRMLDWDAYFAHARRGLPGGGFVSVWSEENA